MSAWEAGITTGIDTGLQAGSKNIAPFSVQIRENPVRLLTGSFVFCHVVCRVLLILDGNDKDVE